MFKTFKKFFNTSSTVTSNFNTYASNDSSISFDDIVLSDVLFACLTMITNDVSKLPLNLIQSDDDNIQTVVNVRNQYNTLLNKPNHYQNIQQFIASWVMSKLKTGNTYVLKNYKNNKIQSLFVLDADRVSVAITPSGEVFYRYRVDATRNLVDYYSSIVETDNDKSTITIPSRFIIHDRFNTLKHDLVGVSPIAASMLSSTQNVRIQKFADNFFKNNSRPGGILTVENLDETKAKAISASWKEKFSNGGSGQLAVFGHDVKYTDLANAGMSALDAQLVEQFNMSAKSICRTFHIAPHLVGVGDYPSFNNIESLNQSYYSQTLQTLLESIELCLTDGLEIGKNSNSNLSVSFDIDALLRMDSESKINTLKTGVGSGIMSPNEARKRMNLKPVAGGDSVFLQQQNYSLEALSKRDSQDDAFATKTVNTTTSTNNNIVKSTSESTNKNFNDDEDVTEYMLSFLREK